MWEKCSKNLIPTHFNAHKVIFANPKVFPTFLSLLLTGLERPKAEGMKKK
jgi:hypothetical protein